MSQVVAAQKGWFVLAFFDEKHGFVREPIIAWHVIHKEDCAEVIPITCEGSCENYAGGYAIEAPEGSDRFISPHDTSFKSLEDLTRHWQSR
jgi:hypothetical protein